MEPLAARNPRVQQLRRLLRQTKARDQVGLFVLEGAGLLAEALAADHVPVEVFVTADHSLGSDILGLLSEQHVPVWELEPSVLDAVASTKSPQPVLSVVARNDRSLDDVLGGSEQPSFIVVAVQVNEPGNAGTIIRTAAAAGADAVIFSEGSVDVFNAKVVRATAGALFRVPVVCSVDLASVWARLSENGTQLIGLAGSSAVPYDTLDLSQSLAIVVGNEAHGLSDEVLEALDSQVSIPMAAEVESVNVAAAVAAVCFEVSRQRRSSL